MQVGSLRLNFILSNLIMATSQGSGTIYLDLNSTCRTNTSAPKERLDERGYTGCEILQNPKAGRQGALEERIFAIPQGIICAMTLSGWNL
jgi:hypothetical protein